MTYKEILYEEKGSVAYLTLNRPDIRNAITGETIIDVFCREVAGTESYGRCFKSGLSLCDDVGATPGIKGIR